MNEEKRKLKNKTIWKTIRSTREKRKNQHCRTYEIKINKSKLSREKKEHIERLFLEGKWLWNHTVAQGDGLYSNRSPKTVYIKTSNGLEAREFITLGSQMKQDIVDSVKTAIKALATIKSKGGKVGHVGYQKYCNSIPLRQYGNTYNIDFENNTISIQGLVTPIKVSGLSQIPNEADIANAKLIKKPSGLYFHITTYTEKEKRIPTGIVGAVDFGIKHTLTFDDGRVVDVCVPESRKIKSDQRKMNRQYSKNGKTKNHYKRIEKIRNGYEKNVNIKKDIANKLVSKIFDTYDIFAIQDEMVSGWKSSIFGRIVQHSVMGRIKAKLKRNPRTKVVPKYFPSTQKCPICGRNTRHPLEKRDYDCAFCGYHHNSRDQKSANMILMEAMKQNVCVERTAKSSAQAMASESQDAQAPLVCKPPPIG